MIVLDASVVVELLTEGPLAKPLRDALDSADEPWLVPHLLDVEVLSALRGLLTARHRDPRHSGDFIEQLSALPAERCSHIPLLDRIWELRQNFTAYDAAYIALAEATGSTLFTTDRKLSRGHRARVVVFGD
jgi:predicted nucleic acid-binding protein